MAHFTSRRGRASPVTTALCSLGKSLLLRDKWGRRPLKRGESSVVQVLWSGQIFMSSGVVLTTGSLQYCAQRSRFHGHRLCTPPEGRCTVWFGFVSSRPKAPIFFRHPKTVRSIILDGEQRKYHNFCTYCVHGLPNTAPDVAAHTRPFRLQAVPRQ
jgi:hypothetical protein